MRNPYILSGIVLLIIGLYFSTFAYFALDSVPFTALGLSTAVVGITSIGLANTRPRISPEASQILLKAGIANTTMILEALGIKDKAIYLPQKKQNGNPHALIPITGELCTHSAKSLFPGNFVDRSFSSFESPAIAVTTPGNLCIGILKRKPGASEDEIRSATNYVLVKILDIASGIKVGFSDSRINIEVFGSDIDYEDSLFYRCLGSPVASIAAAICSEALEKPVRITEEKNHNRKTQITLEVLN